MNSNFEHITNLEYKVKSLTAKLNLFESGEKYVVMRSECNKQLTTKDRKIKKIKLDLAGAYCRTVTVRQNWMQLSEDIEKEYSKGLKEEGHKRTV